MADSRRMSSSHKRDMKFSAVSKIMPALSISKRLGLASVVSGAGPVLARAAVVGLASMAVLRLALVVAVFELASMAVFGVLVVAVMIDISINCVVGLSVGLSFESYLCY